MTTKFWQQHPSTRPCNILIDIAHILIGCAAFGYIIQNMQQPVHKKFHSQNAFSTAGDVLAVMILAHLCKRFYHKRQQLNRECVLPIASSRQQALTLVV
jgi:hypothetical protein